MLSYSMHHFKNYFEKNVLAAAFVSWLYKFCFPLTPREETLFHKVDLEANPREKVNHFREISFFTLKYLNVLPIIWEIEEIQNCAIT